MTQQEVFLNAQALISQVNSCVLCTLHITGAPDARAMLNLHSTALYPQAQTRMPKNKFFTYLTTLFNSEKMSQIRQNPKSALYYSDDKLGRAVTVIGEIKEVQDPHLKKEFWREEWTLYSPVGKESPDYALLEFTPKLYKYYDGNLNIYKYEI